MVTLPQTLHRSTESSPVTRQTMLGAGIVSSVWYLVTDVLGAMRYDGYSYTDQVFSELTAEGSPVRSFMVATNGIPYTLLVLAFAAGVWMAAGARRAGRVTALMLAGYATFGMAGGVLFPMPVRGVEGTLRNAMHIPMTAIMSVFILLAMGFGAMLLGRRFRYYSFATIAVLLVFGALTSLQGTQIAANEPTPWAGLEERVNIYATMLWLGVLAIGLLRREASGRESAQNEPAIIA